MGRSTPEAIASSCGMLIVKREDGSMWKLFVLSPELKGWERLPDLPPLDADPMFAEVAPAAKCFPHDLCGKVEAPDDIGIELYGVSPHNNTTERVHTVAAARAMFDSGYMMVEARSNADALTFVRKAKETAAWPGGKTLPDDERVIYYQSA